MPLRIPESLQIGLLLLLAVISYSLIYGYYGWSDTDQGFIQALSYRITLGQHPYLDFMYVRPPLSPYLHSLSLFILPAHLQTLGERILFYLFCALIVWLGTLTLKTRFDFRRIGISPEFFAVIAFVFSVHNFPPMPWHTIDGLLFGALGIYLISISRNWALGYAGLLALFLAAMSKQSFYPLMLIGPVLLGLLVNWRSSMYAVAAWLGTLGVLGSLIWLTVPEFLIGFIEQTTGITSLRDLYLAGIEPYIKPLVIIVLPLLFIRELNNKYEILAWFRHPMLNLFGLTMAGLLALHIIRAFREGAYVPPSYGFAQACLLLTTLVSLKDFWINPKANFLLLAMVALAWCGGLSWGYASPMLHFTPLLFGCLYIVHQELDFVAPRYFYGIILVLVAWVFAVLYQYPYRDAPRMEISYHAGAVFPGLSHIYTGSFLFNKCQELQDFHAIYGDAFTVLPAFPMAHYLTHTEPPLPIDWAHNAEMDFERNAERLIQQLEEQVSHVFIELDKLDQLTDTTHYGSGLSQYVRTHWKPIKTGTYFEVYVPPVTEDSEGGMVLAESL